MNLSKVALKNIAHRPLSSLLSIMLLAFGVGIIILLMGASKKLEKQFTQNIKGIDMVVGAKGSPLQLILSAIYQVDAPTGNIPLAEFQKLAKNPMVEQAIPLAYGDNFQGYRIIGTTQDYPTNYGGELAEGNWWEKTGEVVLGSRAADLTELKIGDNFHGSHGVSNALDEHDHFEYQVVGILRPTGTVVDKLILTNVESVWAVHQETEGSRQETASESENHHHENDHHDHAEHETKNAEHSHDHETQNSEHGTTNSGHPHKPETRNLKPETSSEITAGLIFFRNPMGMMMLPRMVNQNTPMQAALPSIEVNRLFSLMGAGVQTLRILAILIVAISAISVFISLLISLRERKSELALMRSLGAGSGQIFWIILVEGLLVSLAGFVVGFAFGKLAFYLLGGLAEQSYQFDFSGGWISAQELWLLPITLGIGFLAALIPAIQAYRIDISKTLSNA